MEKALDKTFLLTYTAEGDDGFSHFHHAWFRTEDELKAFLQKEKAEGRKVEEDIMIEIRDYRTLSL